MCPTSGAERILLVHVDDVAKMLVELLQATKPAHFVYNAACESVVIADLKREVESLNSNVRVKLGEAYASGNPRRLDWSRLRKEFGFQMLSISEQLRKAGERDDFVSSSAKRKPVRSRVSITWSFASLRMTA